MKKPLDTERKQALHLIKSPIFQQTITGGLRDRWDPADLIRKFIIE
jgi:hypothetical protein